MGFDPRYPHEVTHRDWTVLLSHPDGAIPGDDGCGLYHHDCRILSRYRLTLDGQELDWVSSRTSYADDWFATLRLPVPGRGPEGPDLPQDAVEVRLRRQLGRGMLESIEMRNHSMVGRSLQLRIELGADFADTLEIAQDRRQQHGEVAAQADGTGMAMRYLARRGDHSTERGIRVEPSDVRLRVASPDGAALTIEAEVDLGPDSVWRAAIDYQPLVGGEWKAPVARGTGWSAHRARIDGWRARRPRLTSSHQGLERTWDIAANDLYALRNRELESGRPGEWVVNAGVPIFTGLFGRDVLTAGWQGALIGSQFMRGALELTARLQATVDDAWLDAEPGKLIHELRRGPFADLRVTAQAGYYGTQTTAAMFPLALSELWHWTGDTELLRRHRETAERALEWARLHGDLDGDGFLEYQQRSPVGIKNQAWKDSHEAIRYGDGKQVPNPIATVEEQAFHFLALSRMAEICVALGDDEAADRYVDRARALRTAWHGAYWMPDESFYAMALDADKRQVTSIGSNAGHALAAGLVPSQHAAAVADRLMEPDMFSGWGVRTLSTTHPAYNPWAYHLGTVWPVENATFALGFKRYGLDDHLERLFLALLDAAALLPGSRLPELIGGQSRDELPFPVAYPQANSPQAWSASATVQLVQIMLGLYPFAPLRVLALVRPRLPAGIDELTLHDVRVGRATVSLRFRRRGDGTASHEVLRRRGSLLLVEAPPPNALEHAGVIEAISSFSLARFPGRVARAARLAMGVLDDG